MVNPKPTAAATILIADDQPDVLRALSMLLRDAGYQVDTAGSPAEVVRRLHACRYDLLLMDLNYARDTTSGHEGVELIRAVRAIDEPMPIVVMTAFGSIDVAVRVLQEGARDFIEKPWDNQRVLKVVGGQLDLFRSQSRTRALEASIRDIGGGDVVAASAAMRDVLSLVGRVGDSDASVLITGENGVGKGVVAAAVQRASPRRDRVFLTVDMGTLSGGLVEAELFGHERGAFTDARGERIGRFELADGGTLFLDEIANCPLDQQSKLLRVIATGEFERLGSARTRSTDVRLVCATNSDLPAEVDAGRFRRDLYYRINTVEIRIPPLRDRREDVPPLSDLFLARFRAKYRRRVRGFSAAARDALARYAWPGNVRELAHAVERAVLLAAGDEITADDLRLRPDPTPKDADALDGLTLEEVERQLVTRALARRGGNVREAASDLGLSRSAMYRRMERFGIGGTDEAEP